MNVSPSFRYDQLAILAGTIIRVARKRKASTLLDIGPGNIGVAYPVSQSVERYVAIERDADAARDLAAAGLEVITAVFPDGAEALGRARFDLVVASHSIPEDEWPAYEAFLDRAWDLVGPGGALLIITFKGQSDDPLMRMRQDILRQEVEPDERFSAMLSRLKRYGEVTVETESSHMTTQTAEDIGTAFGALFWSTPEEEHERKPHLHELAGAHLDAQSGLYRILTDHLVITTVKAP
jgi:predicted O-methyltransferase YrrM